MMNSLLRDLKLTQSTSLEIDIFTIHTIAGVWEPLIGISQITLGSGADPQCISKCEVCIIKQNKRIGRGAPADARFAEWKIRDIIMQKAHHLRAAQT